MTHAKSISIAHTQGSKTLSTGQKKFNSLVKKIDAQRKVLLAWKEGIPHCQQWHETEFAPLLLKHRELLVDMVRLLDARLDDKGFSKADRQALREMVCDFTRNLMHGQYAEEMTAIYNRHSDTDLETEEAQSIAELKAMMESELEIDLSGLEDPDSPEALLQRFRQEMQAREAEDARAAQDHDAQRSQRKPTAKQAKAQLEAENTSQSIREVFRKLASALHPDREPDEAERQRKTALMQRVNQAYANKDLLTLLQLQLEIEQIDQSAIDGIAEDRLKHFNKVLSEQLRELQGEVYSMESGFIDHYNLSPFERVTPATMLKALHQLKQHLQYDTHQMQLELKKLVDVSSIKRWLKVQRANARQSMMEEVMADLGLPF